MRWTTSFASTDIHTFSFLSDEAVPRVIRRSPDANQTIETFDPSPPCCYKAVSDPPPGEWRSVNATNVDEGSRGRQRPYCVEPDSFKLKGQRSSSSSYSSPAGSGSTSSSSLSSSSLPPSTPVDTGMPCTLLIADVCCDSIYSVFGNASNTNREHLFIYKPWIPHV